LALVAASLVCDLNGRRFPILFRAEIVLGALAVVCGGLGSLEVVLRARRGAGLAALGFLLGISISIIDRAAPGGITKLRQSALLAAIREYRDTAHRFPPDHGGGAASERALLEIVHKTRESRRTGPWASGELGANRGVLDEWNKPMRYSLRSGDRPEITSAGPDGEFGTEDDLKRSSRLEE
jgi:hypothetical protein